MKSLKAIEDVDAFMLKHGENIVDLIGAEIDRIEKELKVIAISFPFQMCTVSDHFHFLIYTEKAPRGSTH